ncbi:MAG TPA: molybdopterin cofactor-binding domain-containing protein [Burkholderiaceae bacterium]|nr:molybdopterin cofactor-binding domain-containing protein [Burkholderiaceae bacterium]
MKRRTFLLAGAGALGVLVVGWGVLPPRSRLGTAADLGQLGESIALNGWIRISPDNSVTIAVPRSEMGQGVFTALPMLVAEELDCALSQVRIEQSPMGDIYGNVAMLVDSLPMHPDDHGRGVHAGAAWVVGKLARSLGLQVTGGSSSVKDAWGPMRLAGATARGMLLAAGAAKLGLAAADCTIQDGVVRAKDAAKHKQTVTFGEIAQDALSRPVPDVQLKSPKDFRLIGKPANRIDAAPKSNGTAAFGIDTRLPGMRYAAIRMCPTFGGALQRVDADAIRELPGNPRVVTLPAALGAQAAVAVIADTWWQAKQAVDKLPIVWDAGRNAALSSFDLQRSLSEALAAQSGFSYHDRGDGEAALKTAAKQLTARYTAPLLAHATLEPMNCTAQFKDGTLTLWTPTQVPGLAHLFLGRLMGITSERIKINVTLLGGGFGRRLELDVIGQAAFIAGQAGGAPVQLIWSRDEDTRHDMYRPMAVADLHAGLSADGQLTALTTRQASESVVYSFSARNMPAFAARTPDKTTDEGLFDRPYEIPNQSHRQVTVDSPVPVGFWRSVGHSMNAFFAESFMDECAHAAGKDPLQFRRDLLRNHPRHLKVLDTVAEKAGWGRKLDEGRALGMALHQSFGSIVAQVAEVSVSGKDIRVHRVWCAVDCGMAVNPNIIAQQVEGSVIFGLSAALWGEVTISNGAVEQDNFGAYRLARINEAPQVETYIIASSEAPSGIGEPATPPIAPAVANAVFALTGQRLRSLPLRLAATPA